MVLNAKLPLATMWVVVAATVVSMVIAVDYRILPHFEPQYDHPHMLQFMRVLFGSRHRKHFAEYSRPARTTCCLPERFTVQIVGFEFDNIMRSSSDKCSFKADNPQFHTVYYDVAHDRARFDGGSIVPSMGESSTVILGSEEHQTTYFFNFNDTNCVCWSDGYLPMQNVCLTGDSSSVSTLGDGMEFSVLKEQYKGPSKGWGHAVVYVRHLSRERCVPVVSRHYFHIEEASLVKDSGGSTTFENFKTDFSDDVFELPDSCPSMKMC